MPEIQDYDPTQNTGEAQGPPPDAEERITELEAKLAEKDAELKKEELKPMNFKGGALRLMSCFREMVVITDEGGIDVIPTIEGAVPVRRQMREVNFKNNRCEIRDIRDARAMLEKGWVENDETQRVDPGCLPGELAKGWAKMCDENRLRVVEALVDGHTAEHAASLVDPSLDRAPHVDPKPSNPNQCPHCGEVATGPQAQVALLAHIATQHPEAATG
jgi:hypothetical protein